MIADSDELPLPADDNYLHALLLQQGWGYNRKRDSYRIWFEGGCVLAPDQRHAFVFDQVLRRLERGEAIADEEPKIETSPSEEVIQ
jgi:hypothetical protein